RVSAVCVYAAPSGAACPPTAPSLAHALDVSSSHDLAALCYTSNRVKSSLKHRFAAAGTRTELIRSLRSHAATAPGIDEPPGHRRGSPRVGLLCSGQGSQYPGMTRALYRSCPPYRAHLSRAAEAAAHTLAATHGPLNL